MPPVSADDVVAQASQLLTVVMHCRKQAAELQACQERGSGKRLLSGRCERERAAFVTCSEEHVGVVIGHLVKFADKHCPAEVEAFRWCKSHTPGADCEQEDLAALRCTSAQLLASARANCQFCQFAHAAMKCRRISLSICMYANEKRQRRREGWRLGRADAIGMYIWFGSSVVVGSVRS